MRLANEIAMESRGRLTATTIDLMHHVDLTERFAVTTVPFFVIGEGVGVPGPLPELILLQRIADHTAVDDVSGRSV